MLKSNQPKYNSAINSNRRAWPGQGKEVEDIKTGGPAFPEVRVRGGDNYNPPAKLYYGGMTMRDYFAAKAMQGYLAAPDCGLDMEEVAAFSYKMAGHMLAAREPRD